MGLMPAGCIAQAVLPAGFQLGEDLEEGGVKREAGLFLPTSSLPQVGSLAAAAFPLCSTQQGSSWHQVAQDPGFCPPHRLPWSLHAWVVAVSHGG